VPPTDHEVTLVTRAGCHLCETAEQTLRRLSGELGFGYREHLAFDVARQHHEQGDAYTANQQHTNNGQNQEPTLPVHARYATISCPREPTEV